MAHVADDGVFHTEICKCAGCSAPPTTEEEAAPGAGSAGSAGAGSHGKPVYDDAGILRSLLTSDTGSGSRAWTVDNVTYSINSGALQPGTRDYTFEHGGYVQMGARMQAKAAEAFELWDDLIAIDLDPVANDPHADIGFNYSSATSGNGTYARLGWWTGRGEERADNQLVSSDLWFSDSWWTQDADSDLFNGGYGMATYLHEIGHALGLTHPGPYNGSASFGPDATHYQDTREYTLMSYFDAEENGSGTDHVAGRRAYGSTPLLNDIMAVQELYGADMTTRTDDTVYGFNSTAGRSVFDFNNSPNSIIAIWDAGGTDTIDLSGYSQTQTLYLGQGTISSVGVFTNNLAIARGASIENAIGGSGRDTIMGNTAGNRIEGRGGNDTILGHGGADTLFGNGGNDWLNGGDGDDLLHGGSGADVLLGGDGIDWAAYSRISSAVNVNLNGNGFGGEAAGDWYRGIENARLSDSNDIGWGTDGANVFEGRGGDDRIYGAGGDDTLLGDEGHDMLEGGAGNDRLEGGLGNDILNGGAGEDTLIGGEGRDEARYDGSASGVIVDLGAGTGRGGDAEGDTLSGIESLLGSDHDDRLTGDGGSNWIDGGDGADILDGGLGRDSLMGGAGADTFVFTGESDVDRVMDFEVGTDILAFADGPATSREDLTFGSFRGDLTVAYDRGDVVVLVGVEASEADLVETQFLWS